MAYAVQAVVTQDWNPLPCLVIFVFVSYVCTFYQAIGEGFLLGIFVGLSIAGFFVSGISDSFSAVVSAPWPPLLAFVWLVVFG